MVTILRPNTGFCNVDSWLLRGEVPLGTETPKTFVIYLAGARGADAVCIQECKGLRVMAGPSHPDVRPPEGP